MSADRTPESLPLVPSKFDPLMRPLHAFMAAESAGGIVLLLATLAAFAWANSPWGQTYYDFWHAKLSVGFGEAAFAMSLEHWVNDGLMVIFFLLVGLEIKRELLMGELASLQRAALPAFAAVGGMVVPAGIYAYFNHNGAGSAGWGIPMATDIAFAVGVLAIVGRSVPTSLKVFLLAVAIVDDLGAVLVIALFYTSNISWLWLGIAGAFLAALIILNTAKVHRPLPYILLGIGLWIATLGSGIHATIAGVLLAFTIPATRQVEEGPYAAYVRSMLGHFERDAQAVPDKITHDQSHAIEAMSYAARAVQTPLARVEHALLKPVSFLIVPIFALANAGVDLKSVGTGAFQNPVTWGIVLGLLLGKTVGILLASWIAIKTGAAAPPAGTTNAQIAGVAVLCGIGFTMSLFVANLAFPGNVELLASAKVGILLASLLAAMAGSAIIFAATRKTG